MRRFGESHWMEIVRNWINEDFKQFHQIPPPVATQQYLVSRWKSTLTPASGAALLWLFINRLYFDLRLSDDPRVMLLNYDSIVKNPGDKLRSICEFLHIKYKSKFSEDIFQHSIRRCTLQPRSSNT
jgi:hypothetical protein